MLNEEFSSWTNAEQSTNADVTTSSQTIANAVLSAGMGMDKAEKIRELLYKAAMSVNEVECELGMEYRSIKYLFFVPDEKEPTLWCQLITLEKAFELVACG